MELNKIAPEETTHKSKGQEVEVINCDQENLFFWKGKQRDNFIMIQSIISYHFIV